MTYARLVSARHFSLGMHPQSIVLRKIQTVEAFGWLFSTNAVCPGNRLIARSPWAC